MNRSISLLLIPLLFAVSQLSAYCPIDGFWVPSVEVDGKIGSFRKGAGITLFAPVCQDDNSLMFWQTNFGNYRKVWTGSLGLGYRRLITPYAAFGINGFADVSYSEASRTYGQLGFGGELLGKCWEARFNGYIPTTRRTLVHEEIMGTNPFAEEQTRRLYSTLGNYRLVERSYKGFDAEGGYGVKLWRGQLWGYGGYYWFSDRGIRTIQGPRIRAEYHLFNLFRTSGTRVVIGGEWAYDYLHRNQGLFYVSLRIPLCGFKRGCGLDIQACEVPTLCQRMNNRVIREPGIWIDRTREDEHCDVPILGSLTGAPRHLFFVDNEGKGDGSISNPLSLEKALERGGVEDFFFVVGDIDTQGTLDLKYGQTLIGSDGASEIPLDFVEYGMYNISREGEVIPKGLLRGDGQHPVVRLAHHGVIRGVDIDTNNGPCGVIGDASQNIRISRSSISNAQEDGILLTDALNPTLYALDFHNIRGSAINVSGTNVVLRDLQGFDEIGQHAVAIANSEGVLIDRLIAGLRHGHAVTANGSRGIILRGIKAPKEGQWGDQTVSLDKVTHFALHDSTLASTKETTLNIKNCQGMGLVKETTLNGKDNTVLALDSGDFSLDVTFAGENKIISDGGTALAIEKLKGTFQGKALNIAFTGTARYAPFIVSDVAEASFGEVGLQLKEGCIAASTIVRSKVSFDKLSIVNPTGAGLFAENGEINVGGGAIIANGAPALYLTDIKGKIELDQFESNRSPTHGLALYNFDGTLAATKGKILQAQMGAIKWDEGKGHIQFEGLIRNDSGHLMTFANLDKESSVLVYGGSVHPKEFGAKKDPKMTDEEYEALRVPGIQINGGKGISITNCKGPITLIGAELDVEGPAYSAINSSGGLTLTGAKLKAENTEAIIKLSNCTNFTLDHSELTPGEGVKNGIMVTVNDQLPTIQVIQEGEEDRDETPSQSFTFRDNTFLKGEGMAGNLFDVKITDCRAPTQMAVTKSDFGEADNPFSATASGKEGRLNLTFMWNKGVSAEKAPIRLEQQGGAKIYLAHRENPMRYNPDLANGSLEVKGIVFLGEEPPAPKREEFVMSRALGLLPEK